MRLESSVLCVQESYLVVDGDGAQPVQEEQQGGVHIVEQVSGLMALRAQREADLCGPAEEKTQL